METWEGMGSWKMGGGRGEAHKKEGGDRGHGLMKLRSKDFRHRRQTLILVTSPDSCPSGALEEDVRSSTPSTRPGSGPGPRTLGKCTTS